jgi:ribosomal 50S subunit-associated protein YjgA (DUF615 family)
MTRRPHDPHFENEATGADDADDLDTRRSRSSLKDERVRNENALTALIDTLLKVAESNWPALGLPEHAQDALRDALRIKDLSALARHKKFTRGLLRDLDWPALALRVEQFRSGLTVGDPSRELPEHVVRAHDLVVQGERGLSRFLEEFPAANRTRLRQLIKNVELCSEAKRPRARAVLEQAVLDALTSRPAGPDESLL